MKSIKDKALPLRKPRTRKINLDVFIHPEKYLVRLPAEKVVADTKVYRNGVERYKRKIMEGEPVAPKNRKALPALASPVPPSTYGAPTMTSA